MGTRAGSKPEEKARQEKTDKKKATAENQEKADAKKGELGRSSSPRLGEKRKSCSAAGEQKRAKKPTNSISELPTPMSAKDQPKPPDYDPFEKKKRRRR